ncbi:MAG TPA: hypothetical protein VM900_01300 [Sphingomonas sp.]|nr:hypothetical protein [Sphingomonas sp.]
MSLALTFVVALAATPAFLAATTVSPPPIQGMMCTEPLPAGMESWIDPIFLKSGDVLPVGTAARATMTRDSKPIVAPEKAAATGSHGGTLRFQIARSGRYRVSLGTPVWVEVVRGGKRVKSIAHGHGGECAPVKKKVDYTLSPGAYTLQFSGSVRAIIPVFVGPAR